MRDTRLKSKSPLCGEVARVVEDSGLHNIGLVFAMNHSTISLEDKALNTWISGHIA